MVIRGAGGGGFGEPAVKIGIESSGHHFSGWRAAHHTTFGGNARQVASFTGAENGARSVSAVNVA